LLHPTFVTRTLPEALIAVVEVSGPLTDLHHAEALSDVCTACPAEFNLVVQVSAVSQMNDAGLAALRTVANAGATRGQRVIFLCSELMLRADLVLSDLDTIAPVVDAEEEAFALAQAA
jgi:anti-anti-sigma regulatory factor